jgi:hypothetical protein
MFRHTPPATVEHPLGGMGIINFGSLMLLGPQHIQHEAIVLRPQPAFFDVRPEESDYTPGVLPVRKRALRE